MEKFRRDSMWLGIVIGIVLPTVLFSLLFGLSKIFAPKERIFSEIINNFVDFNFSNLFSLRYYLVKLKYNRTGRGILWLLFYLRLHIS